MPDCRYADGRLAERTSHGVAPNLQQARGDHPHMIMPRRDQVRPVRSDVGRVLPERLSTKAAVANSSIATGPNGAA